MKIVMVMLLLLSSPVLAHEGAGTHVHTGFPSSVVYVDKRGDGGTREQNRRNREAIERASNLFIPEVSPNYQSAEKNLR